MAEIKGIRGSKQTSPTPSIKRDPKIWKRVKTPQGYYKWVRRGKTPKKALPLSKSVKKGSPRAYENLRKSKPIGRGKTGRGPS